MVFEVPDRDETKKSIKDISNRNKQWYTNKAPTYIEVMERTLQPFRYPKVDFTCNKCVDVKHCKAAFDTYNTNGDCLVSK